MISTKDLWIHLIEAKNQEIVKNQNLSALFYTTEVGFSLHSSPNDVFCISFVESGNFPNCINLYKQRLFIEYNELPKEIIDYARLYFPLLMAGHLQKSRPLIISHFAQSLDGKICTITGKSKWISNEENLIHCHRLRALADAVLVGGGTIKADKPKLTVRKVIGKNPKRIFWSSTIDDYKPYKVENGYTILVAQKNKIIEMPDGIDELISYSNVSEPITEVLEKLKASGVDAVFIEGGNKTLSNFYEAQLIDIMQIHIAPIIFGSGRNPIDSKPIDEVSESLQLEGSFISSESHILYHGSPIFKK